MHLDIQIEKVSWFRKPKPPINFERSISAAERKLRGRDQTMPNPRSLGTTFVWSHPPSYSQGRHSCEAGSSSSPAID
jgi:hypothetical protein